MELRALWKIAKRRWWLIAIPAAAAFIYAAYGYFTASPQVGYGASVRFTAATPAGDDALGYEDSEYYPWLTSEYVINGLTDWVKTGSFAIEVSSELSANGIDIPAGAISPAINADNERSVMVLYLNWGDPDQLMAITEAAITVLNERSADYFPQLQGSDVSIVALDEPAVGAVPPPLSSRFDPLIRLALGFAAGIALAALIEYLDPTIRSRAELENIGLPVITEIPRSR